MLSHPARDLSGKSLSELRQYFRALSDGGRLRILSYLASTSDDLKVSDLARALRLSQPLCSWHLRQLVKIGLVKTRRVGREARCSLDRARLVAYQHEFFEWLDHSTRVPHSGQTPDQNPDQGEDALHTAPSNRRTLQAPAQFTSAGTGKVGAKLLGKERS